MCDKDSGTGQGKVTARGNYNRKEVGKDAISDFVCTSEALFKGHLDLGNFFSSLSLSLPPFLLGFKTSSECKGKKSIKREKDVKEWSRKQLQF